MSREMAIFSRDLRFSKSKSLHASATISRQSR